MQRYLLFPIIALSVLLPCALIAQNVTGRVLGTITDPAGAVIPDATVTVTNTATNIARTTTTDREGNYQVLNLPIGPYKVEVSASGFSRAETETSELRINQSLRFDIQLKIGTISEYVQVNVEASPVETVEASLGGSIVGETITNMPLNGRNVMDLVGLQAGVTEQRSGGALPSGMAAYSIAGSRTDSVTYLLDGMVNTDLLSNTLVFNPNPDMIEEFRVVTSNGSAEYGRNAGGIISTVIKSGANSFHGTAYDYLRNEKFNANRYFFNQNDTPRPALKRNQFGVTVNGPVVIPGLVDGKDKLFFSIGYEGQRQRSVLTDIANTVFTPAELNGDFSQSAGGEPDPDVANFLQNYPYFQPDPELAAQAIIDPARINSVAQNYIDAGLIPSSPTGEISPSGSEKRDRDELTVKVDYNPNSSNQLSVTFGANRQPTTLPFSTTGYSSSTPGLPYNNNRHAYLLNLSYTRTFSPQLLNEFRAGAQRNNVLNGVPLGNPPTPADLGMEITPDLPTGPPVLWFLSGLTVGAPAQGPTNLISNTFNIADSVIWSRGHHVLKTGFDLTTFQNNMQYDFIGNGGFDFYGPYGYGSGNDFADFLLGQPTDFVQFPNAPTYIRSKSFSAFVQDEWHVRRNFVLTLGLRYEYSTPKKDKLGHSFSVIPGRQSTVFTNAPEGLLFPGDAGAPEAVNFPDKNNFAPRIGFAWTPGNDRTSIRGGFGVYYDILKAEDNLQFNGQAPFYSYAYIFFDPLEGNPASEPLNFADPFTATGSVNPFPSTPPTPDLDFNPYLPFGGNGIYFVDPHLRTPYVYQYNLTIQRELTTDLVAEIAYVGNASHKLTGIIDSNPFVLGEEYRVLNADGDNFSYLNTFANVGNGNYNSMQLTLVKRPSATRFLGGNGFRLSYTYGHSIDTTTGFRERNIGLVPSYNPGLLRASSDEDVRHRLVFSGQWDLPFESIFGGGPKRLLQGWKIYPIISWRSGYPVDILAGIPTYGSDPGPSGAGDAGVVRANLVGSEIRIYDPNTSRTINDNPGNYWFDPGNFSNEVTSGYGTLGRNAFRGPGRTNVDLSIMKEIFLVRETEKLEFRFDAFNIFNTVQWKDPDDNIDSSAFGQITDTYDPRTIQFALRFIF